MFDNLPENDRRAYRVSRKPLNNREALPPDDHPQVKHPLDSDPLARKASEQFGLPFIYPLQRFVMANILDEVDQLVILPTGSGKSLCFQLPALFLNGLTLVIVPLLALLKDQLRRLKELNIPATSLHGEQSQNEKTNLFQELKAGNFRLLYTTPETLQSPRHREFFKQLRIKHVVIDEAHCVTEWGETFRPAYLGISDFIARLQSKPVITAFTATASERIICKIKEVLFTASPVSLLKGYADRPNIFYRVLPTLSKENTLFELLTHIPAPVLIFTRSRKRAESWARLIDYRLPGQEVFFYHAGLSKKERDRIEDWFYTSRLGILVSTSAYGMGIDKPDIRSVIHIDIPPSLEAYLQESGRAGRDREPAQAVLLYATEDEHYIRKLPEPSGQERYAMMLGYAHNQISCRREYLLAMLGQQLEVCTGCDICRQESIVKPAVFNQLLRFFKKNKRRYTKREALQILSGRYHYEVLQAELYQDHTFGLLADWQVDEITEAFDNLLAGGVIQIPEKGFWKNRITLNPHFQAFSKD